VSRSLRAGVVLLGVGAMIALASVAPTSDPDVFWHLATAREALRTGSWLPVDPFSYSFAGAAWPYKDLAAEVLLYSGFQAMGFAWFALLKALCGAAMIAAMHVAPRPAERSYGGTLVAGGVLLSSFWLLEQPALLSLTFFPIVLALVERAHRAAGEADMRRLGQTLVAAVAVNAVWTWEHRFSVFGHALLALLALDLGVASIASALRFRSPGAAAASHGPSPRAALLAALATATGLLLGALNPNGLRAYTSGLAMASHPELRAEFWEWKQPSLGEMWGAFPVALVVSAIVLAAVAVRLAAEVRARKGDRCHDDDLRRRGPVRGAHAVLLASMAALACTSFRWMPYLAIASVFIGARLLGEQARVRQAPAWALAGCAALLVASVREHVDPRFTVGEDPSFAPAGAVAFARDHGLGGPVVNAFDFGGYLLWHLPGRVQVLVDGRNEIVYPPAFVVRALLAEHDPTTAPPGRWASTFPESLASASSPAIPRGRWSTGARTRPCTRAARTTPSSRPSATSIRATRRARSPPR
jgi:hypothetical protein